MNKILNWFYRTKLGELYFMILLWLDRRPSKKVYLTPREAAQIIKESSKVTEGLTTVKRKVNELVKSKNKEEYNSVLKELEDIVKLGEANDPDRAKFIDILKQTYVKKGNIDIANNLDKARMLDQKINDMYALQAHIIKRNLLRSIRKQRKEGNEQKAKELEQEFIKKYGRT